MNIKSELNNSFNANRFILSLLFLALLFFATSVINLKYNNFLISALRIISGYITCFFATGSLLICLYLKKTGEKIHILLFILISTALSLIVTYPVGVFNIILEGKDNFYQFRIHRIATIYAVIVFAAGRFLLRNGFSVKSTVNSVELDELRKSTKAALSVILLVSIFLVGFNLSRADLAGDEINIGMRSYDMVDGSVARREGYFISTVSHSPLINTSAFVAMQILEPGGFYKLDDWMFRVLPALISVFLMLGMFYLVLKISGQNPALWAAFLLSVCNYHVWMGRIFLREGLLTYMILCSALCIVADRRITWKIYLAGIFFGGALLVKFTALFFIAPFVIYIFINERSAKKTFSFIWPAFVLFLPVVFYNAAAYLARGYMDQPMGKLFNLFGGNAKGPMTVSTGMYTALISPVDGMKDVFRVIADQSGLPLLVIIVPALAWSVYCTAKEKNRTVLFLLLLVVFPLAIFFINGIRSYYLYPVYIFWIALAGIFISLVVNKCGRMRYCSTAVFLIGGFYSVLVSFNTNIKSLNAYEIRYSEPGASGEIIPVISMAKPISATTLPWVASDGLKKIKAFIKSQVQEGDLVLVDDNMFILDYCWYVKKKGLYLNEVDYFAYRIENHVDKIPGEPTVTWLSKKTNYDKSHFRKRFVISMVRLSSNGLDEVLRLKNRQGKNSFYIYEDLSHSNGRGVAR